MAGARADVAVSAGEMPAIDDSNNASRGGPEPDAIMSLLDFRGIVVLDSTRGTIGGGGPNAGLGFSVFGAVDEPPAELTSKLDVTSDRSHPGYAREKARQVARDHGFTRPPVVVHAIARKLGFEVATSRELGSLRARAVDHRIEVNADDRPVPSGSPLRMSSVTSSWPRPMAML